MGSSAVHCETHPLGGRVGLGSGVASLSEKRQFSPLAWHELVEEAEKALPLLVVNGFVLKGKQKIESYLRHDVCKMTQF